MKIKKTENRINYLNQYKNEHYKRYQIVINNKDKDVIEYLDSLPSKTQFLLKVVRELIEKEKKGSVK